MEKRITWRLSLQIVALALGFCTAGPIWSMKAFRSGNESSQSSQLFEGGSDQELEELAERTERTGPAGGIYNFSPLPLPSSSGTSSDQSVAPSVVSPFSPPPVASSSPEPGTFAGFSPLPMPADHQPQRPMHMQPPSTPHLNPASSSRGLGPSPLSLGGVSAVTIARLHHAVEEAQEDVRRTLGLQKPNPNRVSSMSPVDPTEQKEATRGRDGRSWQRRFGGRRAGSPSSRATQSSPSPVEDPSDRTYAWGEEEHKGEDNNQDN